MVKAVNAWVRSAFGNVFSGIRLQRIGELHWIWWWIQSADPLCCVVRLFLFRTCFQCCGSLSKNKFLKVLGGSSLHGARRQAKIAPIYDWQVLGQCIYHLYFENASSVIGSQWEVWQSLSWSLPRMAPTQTGCWSLNLSYLFVRLS